MSEYKRLTHYDENRLTNSPLTTEYPTYTVHNKKEAINRLAELENKIESGQLVELPCKVGDTVYLIYSSEQREPIPFVVDFIVTHKLREEERLFVYDSNGHGGRFGDCSKGNYIWYIGTNKAQAEARLKELK